MSGFEEMASQFQIEDFKSKLDNEYGEVSVDRAGRVVDKLYEALKILTEEMDELHPFEIGIATLIRATVALYLMAASSSPALVGLLASSLVVKADKVNEDVRPVLIAMYEQATGEEHG